MSTTPIPGDGAASGGAASLTISGAQPTPSITPSSEVAQDAGKGPTAGEQSVKQGGDETFEFSFEGDEEKYTHKDEEKTEDGSYDPSKPFDGGLREILKDRPEVLRGLERSHYENRAWRSHGFKSPTELKAHLDRVEGLGGLDKAEADAKEYATAWAGFQAGDPGVIDQWAKDSPEGFNKAVPAALNKYSETNPVGWASEMARTFMATIQMNDVQGTSALAAFNGLYQYAADNPAMKAALDRIAQTINDVYDAATKQATAPGAGGDSKLTQREQELNARDFGLHIKDLNTQASPLIDSAARQALKVVLKGRTVGKEVEADLLADIKNGFNNLQKADSVFQKNAKDLLDARDSARFIKTLKSAISRNMPTAARREWRKYAGISGISAERKAEGQARTEAGQGSAGTSSRMRHSGPWKQGGPDPSIIDYAAMRGKWGRKGADDKLGEHVFLKKGDSTTEWFW